MMAALGGRAGAQGGFEASQRRVQCGARIGGKDAAERVVGERGGRAAQRLQLRDAALQRRRLIGLRQLGERGVERDAQLQGGLAQLAVVEVVAGAQRQLLAGERVRAAAEQRGQPLLRVQHLAALAAAALGAGRRQLAGGAPAALGDLLAGAVADPHDERLRQPRQRRARVAGGDAMGAHDPRQLDEAGVGLRAAGRRQPALGVGERRSARVDDRDARDRQRRRLRLGRDVAGALAAGSSCRRPLPSVLTTTTWVGSPPGPSGRTT